MKDSTLDMLAPLLDALRGYSVLDEIRPAAFHLKGRDFIHFHEAPHGAVADLRLSIGRVQLPVSTNVQQAELLERIEPQLSSIESRVNRRRERGSKRHESGA